MNKKKALVYIITTSFMCVVLGCFSSNEKVTYISSEIFSAIFIGYVIWLMCGFVWFIFKYTPSEKLKSIESNNICKVCDVGTLKVCSDGKVRCTNFYKARNYRLSAKDGSCSMVLEGREVV